MLANGWVKALVVMLGEVLGQRKLRSIPKYCQNVNAFSQGLKNYAK